MSHSFISIVMITSTITFIPSLSMSIPGSYRDEFGCIPSAGYQWCPSKQKCYRSFEETCATTTVTTLSVNNNCGGFSNCIAYNDGCNNCNCIAGTKFIACTEIYCSPPSTPDIEPPVSKCITCIDGYTLNPTTNECELIIKQQASCGGFPNCNLYTGGCDNCWCGIDGTQYPICSGCASPPPDMVFPEPHCTGCIDGYILNSITYECEPCKLPVCQDP
eukprot:739007_1